MTWRSGGARKPYRIAGPRGFHRWISSGETSAERRCHDDRDSGHESNSAPLELPVSIIGSGKGGTTLKHPTRILAIAIFVGAQLPSIAGKPQPDTPEALILSLYAH